MRLVAAPRPWPGAFGSIWWALRALRSELFGFRFTYPIEAAPAAGSKASLHYHVYSERLFFDAMELDAQGIPLQRSRSFADTYNPAYVAWYGLIRLERFRRGLDPAGDAAFLNQVDWLQAHAVQRDDGTIVWPYSMEWWEGHCHFKPPWISAMAQGLAMSALVRGYRMTGRRRLLDLGHSATRVFEKNVEDGGVRTQEAGYALYEEYPGYPLPRVLDGFLFGLLGLYDLATETGDPRVFQLFTDGIDGLKQTLPFWNYRDRWSWYGSHGYLCPPHYHILNGTLLSVLERLTGDSLLGRYVRMWNPKRLSLLDRTEIFMVFAVTKNWARVRFHNRKEG